MESLTTEFKTVTKTVTVSATANAGFSASVDFSESGYSLFAMKSWQTNQGAFTRLCSFWNTGDVAYAYYYAASTASVTVYATAIMRKN